MKEEAVYVMVTNTAVGVTPLFESPSLTSYVTLHRLLNLYLNSVTKIVLLFEGLGENK